MKFNDDAGSAVIDFVLYGVVFQISLLMFGLQAFQTQSDQLAAESIARHALRSYSLAGIDPNETAAQVLADFGITKSVKVQLLCDPDCESEGSLLELTAVVGSATAVSKSVR